MTLIVVGNVDSRATIEQISKAFGELKGKRETPAALPTLSPLRPEAVSIMTNAVRQDRLSIMWDAPWTPIRESAALLRYWRADLSREALFWHVQQKLSRTNTKDIGLGFDCRVLYLRAQCGINLDSPGEKLENNLGWWRVSWLTFVIMACHRMSLMRWWRRKSWNCKSCLRPTRAWIPTC